MTPRTAVNVFCEVQMARIQAQLRQTQTKIAPTPPRPPMTRRYVTDGDGFVSFQIKRRENTGRSRQVRAERMQRMEMGFWSQWQ